MNTKETYLEGRRAPFQNRLTINKLKALQGQWAYTVGTMTWFTCYQDIGLFAFAFLPYLFATNIVKKTPKMLVLRSFEDRNVDIFLRRALKDLGISVRPIWLRDIETNSHEMPSYAPSFIQIVFRIVVGTVFVHALISTGLNSLPYEMLWVAWIIAGSTLFYRYQAGASASGWLALLFSVIFLLICRDTMRQVMFFKDGSQWLDAFQLLFYCLILFACSYFILEKIPFLQRIFSKFYFKQLIDSDRDLRDFRLDIEEKRFFKRYLPTASVRVIEIQSSNTLWQNVVLTSIDNCSLLLVDLTNITGNCSLSWEIQQASFAGMPVFFTCNEAHVERAGLIASTLGYHCCSMFPWKLSSDENRSNYGIDFDKNSLICTFEKFIESHAKISKSSVGPFMS